MSVARIVLLAALVACVSAATTPAAINRAFLNFGTFTENFTPAPGFVLTTRASQQNLGSRDGVLTRNTVIVVKVGPNVNGIEEGSIVYPTTQQTTAASNGFVYCPEVLNLNPQLITGQLNTNDSPGAVLNGVFANVPPPSSDNGGISTTAASSDFNGRYCLYHESQIAATINTRSTSSGPGFSQVNNGFGFVPNVAGTTRPTL